MASLSAQLVKGVGEAISGRHYALLDWPSYPNAGDHAIWVASQYLLRRGLGAAPLYVACHRTLDLDTLSGLPADIPIVFKGGGNLGDLWPGPEADRQRVIRRFPHRRIVLLPQTINILRAETRDRIAAIYRAHPDLWILTREQTSYALARNLFGAARVRLLPDAVFALAPVLAKVRRALDQVPTIDCLYLLREDKEAAADRPALPDGSMVRDWPAPSWLRQRGGLPGRRQGLSRWLLPMSKAVRFRAEALGVAESAGLRDILADDRDIKSWCHVVLACQFLLQARRIVTDRLHGHILAALLEQPSVLIANNYYKNEAFFRTWMEGRKHCGFAPTLDGIDN